MNDKFHRNVSQHKLSNLTRSTLPVVAKIYLAAALSPCQGRALWFLARCTRATASEAGFGVQPFRALLRRSCVVRVFGDFSNQNYWEITEFGHAVVTEYRRYENRKRRAAKERARSGRRVTA